MTVLAIVFFYFKHQISLNWKLMTINVLYRCGKTILTFSFVILLMSIDTWGFGIATLIFWSSLTSAWQISSSITLLALCISFFAFAWNNGFFHSPHSFFSKYKTKIVKTLSSYLQNSQNSINVQILKTCYMIRKKKHLRVFDKKWRKKINITSSFFWFFSSRIARSLSSFRSRLSPLCN